ncbi:hypothetical protein IJ670_05255, partial [bacterium]|nr:hypothetical protein [bacterium]
IRIDFDKDVVVILKIDKDGKIQTHFIPGSSAVEEYLRNNIPLLKQIFDKENIGYSELSYSRYKQNQNKQKRSK